MGKNVHVVKNLYGGWSVKQEKAQRSSGNFNTQKQAIERAIERAKIMDKRLLCMERMDKSGRKIVMGMILILLKDDFDREGTV